MPLIVWPFGSHVPGPAWHPGRHMSQPVTDPAQLPPFGTAFGEMMSVTRWRSGEWSEPTLEPVEPLALHPGAHVLHYGSACFEGLKAHRGVDDVVRLFRSDRHAARLMGSASRLRLPVPPVEMTQAMMMETVRANLDLVPAPPGSLYLRPTLIGTAPNIGAAGSPSSEAMLYILTSPVGDYFAGGVAPLQIAVETERWRTTPQFGSVKAGANYAMALGPTMEAKERHDVAQVLFAPGGVVQETGASNLLLIGPDRVMTPPPDGSLLEGVTRDSILALAADQGMQVEERAIRLDELLDWASRGEVALAGTAAVLAPVGGLVVDGETVTVGDGQAGAVTLELRQALIERQIAKVPDDRGWTVAVT